MTLAQVVYKISTDADFAAQWRTDPEATLAQRGIKLSKEEQAFLMTGLKRYDPDSKSKVKLSQLGYGLPWYR